MGRAPCCDKATVKRGPWSPDEDATLKNYIQKHGTGGNWIALPQKAGLKRCGKSCRLRWLNYLRPDIKHGGFSEEEDNIIRNLYNTYGSRWSLIASKLPGRTDNDVKNYWNTKLKKKLQADRRIVCCKRGNYHNTDNSIGITNKSTIIPNLAEISISNFISETENYNSGNPTFLFGNSTTLPPLMEMGNYQRCCYPKELILDQSQFPSHADVPNLITAAGYNSRSISPSQEVSSLSSPSSLALENYASLSGDGSVTEDERFLLDFGFDFPNDFLNGFDFQEKCTESVPGVDDTFFSS